MLRYRNSFDDWKHRGPPDPLGLFLAFNNQMNTGEPDNDLQCRCDNDKRTAFFLMDVEMSDDGFNQVQRDADNEEAEQEQKDKDCTNHA